MIERVRKRDRESKRIQTYHFKLIFLLPYPPPTLLCSGRPGAGAGRHFNYVVGKDEKGIQVGRVYLCVHAYCVCVCVFEMQY